MLDSIRTAASLPHMATPVDATLFKDALIVLGAAAVVVPVFHSLRVSPVLGYVLIGMVVGPFGRTPGFQL